jgi:hypothetical protein
MSSSQRKTTHVSKYINNINNVTAQTYLDGPLRHQTVDVDGLLLPDAVRAVLRLQVRLSNFVKSCIGK